MSKRKPQLKRITRAIAWLLILSIIAGFLNAFVAPKVARAADPNMILLWDGGAAPAGWTIVSDGAGEDFYNGIFPRGSDSHATGGGAATHTHTATAAANSGTPSGNSAAATGTTGTVSGQTHTHATSGTASLTSISNLPAYRDLMVIQYNTGIPTTIPSGAIAIFDSTVANQMPNADWGSYSGTQGTNYVRGNATAAGTGGDNTHGGAGHIVSGITLTSPSSQQRTLSGTAANNNCLDTHTHTACNTNNTTDTPNTEPPYINVLLGKTNKDTATPGGMIAMFDGSSFDSYGWENLSTASGPFYHKFLKSATTYSAGSGAETHSHAVVNCTSTTFTAASKGTALGTGGIDDHSHTTAITINAPTGTTLPPYTDVIIAKKSYDLTVTTDQPDYPTQPLTISVTGTAYNYSNTALANTKIDYVIFRDTVTGDHQPTANEKYMYKTVSECDTSGLWGTDGPGYTFQTTGFAVGANSTVVDETEGPGVSHSCVNSAFPDNDYYDLWGKWYANGGTPIYMTAYYTFHSVPTLTEILFLALVGCAVFLGVRTGVIKIRKNGRIEPEDIKDPPIKQLPIENSRRNNHQGGRPFDYRSGFRASPSRSIDGISRSEIRKKL